MTKRITIVVCMLFFLTTSLTVVKIPNNIANSLGIIFNKKVLKDATKVEFTYVLARKTVSSNQDKAVNLAEKLIQIFEKKDNFYVLNRGNYMWSQKKIKVASFFLCYQLLN